MTQPSSTQPLATIIAVHYGPPEPTVAYARALADLPGRERLRLALVDQSGTLDAADFAPGACEHLLRPPRNLGYLGGLNFAIAHLVERGEPLGRWMIGSNPDVRLAPDFAEALAALHIESAEPIAVVAPRIDEPGRGDVNPFLRARPSAFRILAQAVVFGVPPLARAYEALHHARRRRSALDERASSRAPQRIYAAHGSLFVMARVFAERQAARGYPAFLYGEEIHLAELARAWGYGVWYAPALGARHAMAETTRDLPARQRDRWRSQSRWALWRMHFAPRALRGRGGTRHGVKK